MGRNEDSGVMRPELLDEFWKDAMGAGVVKTFDNEHRIDRLVGRGRLQMSVRDPEFPISSIRWVVAKKQKKAKEW